MRTSVKKYTNINLSTRMKKTRQRFRANLVKTRRNLYLYFIFITNHNDELKHLTKLKNIVIATDVTVY